MFKANVTHTETNSIYDMLEEHNGGDILNNMEVGFSSTRSHLVRFHLWTEKQEENSTCSLPGAGERSPSGLVRRNPSFSRPPHSTCCISRSRTALISTFCDIHHYKQENKDVKATQLIVIFHFQSNSNLLGAKIIYTYIMYMCAYIAIYTWKKER